MSRGRVDLEARGRAFGELEVGVETMQLIGGHHPGPRLEVHELGDLVRRERRFVVATLLRITYVPAITTWLPRLALGN